MNPLLSALSRDHIMTSIPFEDVVDKQRFALFRIFSVSGALVCWLTATKMLMTIPDAGILPWVIIGLSVVMAINYFFVASAQRLLISYRILLFASFALLHFVAYSCGGIRTGGLLYHGVIILYAYLMLGKKGGRMFAGLFALNALYFYFISSYTSLTSFAMFKEDVELVNQDFIVNALFSFFLIAKQGNYLQSGKNIIIQRLEKSKRDLEEKNKLLEESNQLLQRYTKNLEKSNKELDKFASVASHDLKAPLRAIGTLADFLEMDLDENLNDDSRKNLLTIKNRVQRMELLLDALLNYSKVDRRTRQWKEFDTEVLMDQVLLLLPANRNYKINIENKLPTIFTDEFVWKSVMEILLDNAIKFNDKSPPEIRLSSFDDGEYCHFCVSDNGIGIEEKYFDKIFVIFQTISPRDAFETTGAGLAVAKKLMENYGGKIKVSSRLNEGSTFTFSIPLNQNQSLEDLKAERNWKNSLAYS